MSGENIPKGTGWAGNYSRFSYDVAKSYVALLKEQGVPLLDDELNFMQMSQIAALRRLFATTCGDGAFTDGFKIVGTTAINDFTIKAGRMLVDGWLLENASDTTYSGQPITQTSLTTPGNDRTDQAYLEVWLDEIDGADDLTIIDPALNMRTSCRLKLNWAVKVAEGETVPTSALDVGSNTYYWRYHLSTISRTAVNTIAPEMVADQRAIISTGAASETVVGHTRFATSAETLTGTSTTTACHPAGVKAVVDALLDGAPTALNTLHELATALGDDANFASTVTTAIGLKAPISSPTFTGTPAAPTANPGTNTTQLATTEFVQEAALGANPSGTILFVAQTTAPAGYLKANGAAVLVASYPTLVSAIYCGDGNNATALFGYRCDNVNGTGRSITGTYLVIPDMRGEFPRGWDDARGIDTARAFGTAQDDAIKSHNHSASVSDPSHVHTVQGATQAFTGGVPAGNGWTMNAGNTASAVTGISVTVNNSTAPTPNETRSRNIALLACIKY